MILIIEKEPSVRIKIENCLKKEGYPYLSVSNGKQALDILEKEKIALVICNLKMPGLNGIELIKAYKQLYCEQLTQFIIISNLNDTNSIRVCFREGAADFLSKPLILEEFKKAIEKALKKYRSACEQQEQQEKIKQNTLDAYKLVAQKQLDLVYLILRVIQARDSYTKEHCERVCKIVDILCQDLNIPLHYLAEIKLAALIHDLGNISIPEEVLLKPSSLTEKEYDLIKEHPKIGFKIIKDFVSENISYLVLHHHEKFNGKGYPSGLKGTDIPIGNRVIALADTYDALRIDRPHRKKYSKEQAIKTISKNENLIFDPELVKVFLSNLDKIEKIYTNYEQIEMSS